MIKVILSFLCCLGFSLGGMAAAGGGGKSVSDLAETSMNEQRHFLECLAYVYSPSLWFSYNGSLYFTTMNRFQAQELEKMKEARSQYVTLTNRLKWHEMASKGVAASGVDPSWREKLLLPSSEAHKSLTPTLNRAVWIMPTYTLLQRLGNGDALIQDSAGVVYFVMNFGRALDDAGCTNGLFIKEGDKTYTMRAGGQNTVLALTSVGLNADEKKVLQRISTEFRREAALQVPAVIPAQDREEFDLLKARANDNSPYMQYLVAKAYLEGKGTQKDERLGLEWMRRADANGSGDAKSYLQIQKQKEAK